MTYLRAVDVGVRTFHKELRPRPQGKLAKLPQLRSTYRKVPQWIFRELTLSLSAGDRLLVVAEDQEHRSVLLRTLCGLLVPDEGRIDTSVRSVMVDAKAKKATGRLSVRQSIRVLCGVYGMTDSEIDSNFDQIVVDAHIRRRLNRPIKDCDPNLAKQISIAISLLPLTQIVAVNNILPAGDERFRSHAEGLFQSQVASMKSILFTCGNAALAQQLATGGLLLDGERWRLVDVDEALAYQKGNRRRTPARPDDEEEEDEGAAQW